MPNSKLQLLPFHQLFWVNDLSTALYSVATLAEYRLHLELLYISNAAIDHQMAPVERNILSDATVPRFGHSDSVTWQRWLTSATAFKNRDATSLTPAPYLMIQNFFINNCFPLLFWIFSTLKYFLSDISDVIQLFIADYSAVI